MTGPRTAARRGETGFVAPDGQVWEVPAFPCPEVVVGAEYAEIDGERVPLGDDEADPRSAATAVLVAQARRLRRGQGAIRAKVRTADSDVVWQAIVTANGELFDATPAPGTARSTRLPPVMVAARCPGSLTNGESPAKDTDAPLGIATDPAVCSPSSAHQCTVLLAVTATTGCPSMRDRCRPPPELVLAAARGSSADHTGTPVAGSRTATVGDPAVPVTVTILPSAVSTGTLPAAIGADQSACPP